MTWMSSRVLALDHPAQAPRPQGSSASVGQTCALTGKEGTIESNSQPSPRGGMFGPARLRYPVAAIYHLIHL